jgi:hypothetical protein
MILIEELNAKFVEENRFRFFKRHLVLFETRKGFGLIPFELDHTYIVFIVRRESICKGLRQLTELQQRRGLSYIFISHDLAVIRAMAHRVMVMKDGDVVEEGETLALFDAPVPAYTRELIAAAHLV